MVGEDGEAGEIQVAAGHLVLQIPAFRAQRHPMALTVEVSAVDVDGGARGAVGMFLLQGGTEEVDASVAAQAEKSERGQSGGTF